MAEFLERSMTAKTRERQPSPLAPNGKEDIEWIRCTCQLTGPQCVHIDLYKLLGEFMYLSNIEKPIVLVSGMINRTMGFEIYLWGGRLVHIHRGGSRGRVQGVHTPPSPWDDLRFSNTTGILQKKKTMWFIGVEVEQGTSAPPPKKNPRSAPEQTLLVW